MKKLLPGDLIELTFNGIPTVSFVALVFFVEKSDDVNYRIRVMTPKYNFSLTHNLIDDEILVMYEDVIIEKFGYRFISDGLPTG
jgi:hypothetical protein